MFNEVLEFVRVFTLKGPKRFLRTLKHLLRSVLYPPWKFIPARPPRLAHVTKATPFEMSKDWPSFQHFMLKF